MTSNSGDATRRSELRLARVLEERRRKEGGFSALERAIALCNGVDPDAPRGTATDRIRRETPDRRKLAALVKGDSATVLSIGDLRAIDCYLERFGQGLAYLPLFEKPDIIQTLAEAGRVSFLLGSKPEGDEEGRQNVSHWDVLAMAELQRAITATELPVGFDVQEFPLHRRAGSLPSHESASHEPPEAWKELLEEGGPSVVCFGSSRSILAADEMLCRMLGTPPFQDASVEEKRHLPFHFIWKSELPHSESYLHLDAKRELARLELPTPEAISAGRASGLALRDCVLVDQVSHHSKGETYGVCVAQRRRRGQVWLVLAGLTGAATFAAAKLVRTLGTNLHTAKPGEESQVYWAVVEARVAEEPGQPLGGLREFAEQRIYRDGFWPEDPA
jgi:hypothetical protein